jgi:hypothetical protein
LEAFPVDLIVSSDTGGEMLPPASPKAPSPEPVFSSILESVSTPKPYMIESAPTPAMAKFNVHNLLNGQYPPPDSGAGYLFTHISLNSDD